jgi:hypothetical protein
MHYSKRALLIFGTGLVLGLVVVAARVPGLARVASLAMAAGIVALPFAVFADWRRRFVATANVARRRVRAKPGRRRAAPKRRRNARGR